MGRKSMGVTIGRQSWSDWRNVPKEEFDGRKGQQEGKVVRP